jgi:hypothetical protein
VADKAKATGPVYRDEAADLMAAAARGTAPRPAPPELELTARRAAPVVRPEPERPLPYPEPVGINDNADDEPLAQAPMPRALRRRNPLQVAARVLIAPLYVVIAVAAIGIDALFVKDLFGF